MNDVTKIGNGHVKHKVFLWIILLVTAVFFAACSCNAATVTKMAFETNYVKIGEGQTTRLKITAWNRKKEVKPSLTWSSSNEKVVSITETTRRTAVIKAHKAGTAYITATDAGGKSRRCYVVVETRQLRFALADISWNTDAGNLGNWFRAQGYAVDLITDAGSLNTDQYDGLLIPGGLDISPSLYGQSFNGTGAVNATKDAL